MRNLANDVPVSVLNLADKDRRESIGSHSWRSVLKE